MKDWQDFHQLIQQDLDPFLKTYGFEATNISSDPEGALRVYSSSKKNEGISINVVRRVRVDINLLPVDIYWLRVEGGIRIQGGTNLSPIDVRPSPLNQENLEEAERYMKETGWIFQTTDELKEVISELKNKFRNALKITNSN